MILNTNLSRRSLGAFINLYDVFISVFGQLWRHHVILQAILRAACPIKANASYIVGAVTKVFILLKRDVHSEGHFNIIYNSTLKRQWTYLYFERNGENQQIFLTKCLMYVWSIYCPNLQFLPQFVIKLT